MKRPLQLLVGLSVFVSVIASTAFGQYVPRTVLMEEGTNWSCGPCATANPSVEAFIQQHVGGVIQIAYHPNWPGSDDPMYKNDPTDNQYRVATYYGINGVPGILFDGMNEFTPGSGYEGILHAIWASRVTVPSPIAIQITRSVSGSTVSVHVTLTAVSDVSSYSPLYLRVAAVESEVDVKGPNGEPKYVNAMRTMMPNYKGTKVTLAVGQSQNFDFTYPINSSYTASRMFEVAFVQTDNSTHEILQAASSEQVAQQLQPKPGTQLLGRINDNSQIGLTLTNNSARATHYTISYVPTSINPWNVKVNGQDATSPLSVDVPVGTSLDLNVTATPGASGYTSGMISAKCDDGTQSYLPFKLIASDVKTAFVDLYGDSASAMQSMLALTSLGERYVALTGPEISALDYWKPSEFQTVLVGGGKWILDGVNKSGAAAYLNAGGHLLVQGGEIAYGLADASASATNDVAFLQNTLKAAYVKDSAGPRTVSGVAGDSISGGLLGPFDLYASSAAIGEVNQPDEITAVNGSTPIFYYGSGQSQVAGIRWNASTGSAKLVYLAFGLENLSTADESSITSSILTWFRSGPGGIAGVQSAAQPKGFSLDQNYPNPFNPTTVIAYSLDRTGPATLQLFDSRGDLVKQLASGVIQAGSHTITLDASQLPSGTYFYLLRSGSQSLRKAMTLVK